MKQDYICAGALTEEALTGAVSDFLYRVRPHRERLWDYYEGQQPVPKGRGRPGTAQQSAAGALPPLHHGGADRVFSRRASYPFL